ncbi:hypothetical protein LWI29_021385 [Acer saccharum]|uniref:DUF4220 domain-containing protein n=1 Tax=Acer saccharum TaxID=4024 RepID=A0AA39SWD0_ACESA|nr:hypothetical protein LWI29_021385 [Acer saccharum]
MELGLAYTFNFFRIMSPEYAFKVIEIELGMMYDLLYTKSPLLFTRGGIVLRLITFFLTCSVMVLFPVLVDKHKYSKVDLSITYLLIIVAVVHDIYAALLMVFSDSFAVWLIEHRNDSIIKTLNCFPLLKRQPSTSTWRWSNKMSQCSLLRFTSSKAKPKMSFKLLNKRIECKYWHCEVSEDLRKLIFEYVWQKAEDAKENRGTNQWKPPFTELPYTINIVQQLIKSGYKMNVGIVEVWYYLDKERFQTDSVSDQFRKDCKMIKRVSRYMMYLLAKRPSTLSLGDRTYSISVKDIRKIADKERIQLTSRADKITSNKAEACKRLLDKYLLHNYRHDNEDDDHRPNSSREELLIYLAMELVRKVNHEYETIEKKWEKIESAWMDMLGYGTRKSKGNVHAQQLRRGGELLTHVWLLLCHFDLTTLHEIERDKKIKRDEEE